MSEWETEEEILRSMGNGQYEDYRIVSADEAERRVLDLEAQRDALLEALGKLKEGEK